MIRTPHFNLHSVIYPLKDDYSVQANYPQKLPKPEWDKVHVEYPAKKYIDTGLSSETIARKWIPTAEVFKDQKTPIEELKHYFRDYNITKQLTRSQTTEDFGRKLPDTNRFNKHTSCTKNDYVYPPSRKIADRVPQLYVHGTTEMRNNYMPPVTPSRLITNKDQYKLLSKFPQDPLPTEPSWHKELPPLDTTHDGFEKYLDPYLTTSRLHHRPYTADQLQRLSCNKDVVTYYTFKDVTYVIMFWKKETKRSIDLKDLDTVRKNRCTRSNIHEENIGTRTPKPQIEWRLPVNRPKSVYDREKFKEGFIEIRTHNKLQWVPGTFRTETRDNYIPPNLQPASQIHNYEEQVKSYYEKGLANLSVNFPQEYTAFKNEYSTENSVVGSKKPICTVLDQFREKNKRVERKS